MLYYDYSEDFDDDDCDEESVSFADWEAGWNARTYAELSERERWNVDHPDYDYDTAKNDELLFDIPIIEPWKEYSEEKCDTDDDDDFPSYSEWEEKKNTEEDS